MRIYLCIDVEGQGTRLRRRRGATKLIFKQTMTELAYISSAQLNTPEELNNCLKNIKHIALDMDGTIYNGSTLFPFTIPFSQNPINTGIDYSFLTHNPSESTNELLSQLAQMGVVARKEEMYTSAQPTIEYRHNNLPRVKRLFILGTPSMISEFEAEGFISTSDD